MALEMWVPKLKNPSEEGFEKHAWHHPENNVHLQQQHSARLHALRTAAGVVVRIVDVIVFCQRPAAFSVCRVLSSRNFKILFWPFGCFS